MAKASISRRNAWRLQIGRARWRGGKFAADDECVLQHIDDTLHFERGCMKSAALKVRFARDSPVEGTGFEPPVPQEAFGVVVAPVCIRADFALQGIKQR